MKLQKNQLKTIISRFKHKKILVVGDLILDHLIFGTVDRISPEAPVPVVWVNKESFLCGGAANVGLNLKALDAEVSLCGVIGNDQFGKDLLSLAGKKGIDTKLVLKDGNRPTTLKTRVTAHQQQVVRVDRESLEPLFSRINKLIIRNINKRIDDFDAVIIEDYGKGVINPFIIKTIIELCRKKKKIITVDPKEEHFNYYQNVTALTPNLKEAEGLANIKAVDSRGIIAVGKRIIEKLAPEALLVTLGEGGMALFSDGSYHNIPTAALEVFDVTGAGDTVISLFTLSLACGASYGQAALIANFAAGIVVGKLGAATTTKKELLRIINEN